MNRHARYALLTTPLLVSAVVLTPTMARAAAPAAAPAAVPQATCALQAAPNTNPQEFDLVLTGFRPNQTVKVTGPESFTRTTNQQGSFTEEDVKKGSYTAKTQGNQNRMTVGCTKPARTTTTTTAVRVTDVDITGATTATPEVDCSVAQSVTFTGKVTGTGTGDVDVQWQGSNKSSNPTLKFTAPETPAPSFVSKSSPRAAATDPVPKVGAQLSAGKASDLFVFTLKCKAGT